MRGRFLLAGVGLATTLFALSALPALGADSASLNVHVTVADPCVTIGPEPVAIDFGTQSFHTGDLAPAAVVSQQNATVTNCSTANERLYARGTTATAGPTTWQLSDTYQGCFDGPNVYGLTVNPLGGGPFAPTLLSTSNKQLPNDTGTPAPWPAGHAEPHQFLLYMPCAGSAGAGQTMSMQIVFTASF